MFEGVFVLGVEVVFEWYIYSRKVKFYWVIYD